MALTFLSPHRIVTCLMGANRCGWIRGIQTFSSSDVSSSKNELSTHMSLSILWPAKASPESQETIYNCAHRLCSTPFGRLNEVCVQNWLPLGKCCSLCLFLSWTPQQRWHCFSEYYDMDPPGVNLGLKEKQKTHTNRLRLANGKSRK